MKTAEILINRLKELKNSETVSSYTHIKNILYNQLIPVPVCVYKPFTIIRTRTHKDSELYFYDVNDLSYRKDIMHINSFGRANEPGQGLFYCNDNLNEGTGFAESMEMFRGKVNEFETITIGTWKVKRDLKLAIILPPKFKDVENELTRFWKLINPINDGSENYKELETLLDFLADEFTLDLKKDSSNYKITCAFTNYIRDTFPEIDGIVYASVKTEFKGINMVLWPEIVEEELNLIGARKRVFKKINDKNFLEIEYSDSKKIDYESGKIYW